MKNTWKAGLAVVALAASAGAAKADVTLSGPTGLFLNPTAQVAQKSAPEVAVNYQRLTGDGGSANLYGIAGAIQLADKLELNGGYRQLSNNGFHVKEYNAGVKYQVVSQKEKGFDLAVGADYNTLKNFPATALTTGAIYTGSAKSNRYDLYLVGTKSFAKDNNRAPIEASLGVRWNHNTLNADLHKIGGVGPNSLRASDSENKVDVFAGVAVPLTKTGEVSLIGELGSKRSSYDRLVIAGGTPYSIGVRYHPEGSSFNVGAGYARGNFAGAKGFFLQAGYQFGK